MLPACPLDVRIANEVSQVVVTHVAIIKAKGYTEEPVGWTTREPFTATRSFLPNTRRIFASPTAGAAGPTKVKGQNSRSHPDLENTQFTKLCGSDFQGF